MVEKLLECPHCGKSSSQWIDLMLDKVYHELAKQCMKECSEEKDVGEGCFYDLLPTNQKIGVDIDPKRKDVIKGDYLKYKLPNKPLIVIGNPPFGHRGVIALEFINHSKKADFVGFILPMFFDSKGKGSIKHRVKGFNLIYSEQLAESAFYTPNNNEDNAKILKIINDIYPQKSDEDLVSKGKGSIRYRVKELNLIYSEQLEENAFYTPNNNEDIDIKSDYYLSTTFYGENKVVNTFEKVKYKSGVAIKINTSNEKEIQKVGIEKLKVQALNHPEAGLATEIPFGKVIRDFFKILTSETYVYGVRFLSANGEIKQLETEIKELEMVTHGFVVDETGRKMSKSLGNVIEPSEIVEKFGVDVVPLLHFCINDLSSFYLEISKDSLYCDSLESPRRKQIITVLYYLLAGLLKIIAPFLPFLAEEVYENIPFSFGYAEKESVLFLPDSQFLLTAGESNTELIEDFLLLRQDIFSALEKARQAKIIHTNSQAQVLVIPKEKAKTSQFTSLNLARLLLIAQIKFIEKKSQTDFYEEQNYTVKVAKTSAARCVRC
ncbi:21601_t:CDS:2 [Entrophospora sp. SA101]|nr:21601_t:CDS:2 [Entrophospora sp. SA101]